MGSEEWACPPCNASATDLWVRVVRKALCRLEDIPDGGVLGIEHALPESGAPVILTRRGDRVRAFHNECPHAGRRLDWAPGRFLFEGSLLVCAAHGATFALDTGAGVGGPCRGAGLRAVAVQVIDGDVVAD